MAQMPHASSVSKGKTKPKSALRKRDKKCKWRCLFNLKLNN